MKMSLPSTHQKQINVSTVGILEIANKGVGIIMKTSNLKFLAAMSFTAVALTANAQVFDPAYQNFAPAGTYVPSINTFDKKQVTLLYQQYLIAQGTFDKSGVWNRVENYPVDANFTGNVDTCDAGDMSPQYREAGLREVSFFRALSKLSSLRVGNALDIKRAQAAALVNAAIDSGTLTHNPANSAKCFSALALEGAQRSNIGVSSGAPAPSGFSDYLEDGGPLNYYVGHRRSFMWPRQSAMTYGGLSIVSKLSAPGRTLGYDAWSISDSNYTQTTRPLRRPEFVSWPTAGYFPSLFLGSSANRWSFSCEGCSFTKATVELRSAGQLLPPVAYEKLESGVGDPTLVFKPQGIVNTNPSGYAFVRLQGEYTYDVTVKGVVQGGVSKDFTYQVIVYDQQRAAEEMLLPKWNVTDMWWAGSQENGWGISLNQGTSGTVFGTWYYYGADGAATWATVVGNWETPTRFTGNVTTTTGSPYTQGKYDPAQLVVAPSIGTMSMDFSSPATATMSYTVNGVSGLKAISRLNFAAPKYTDGSNYTSIWWVGSAENGWGLSINQQFRTMFAVAYIYDANGKPTWFTLSGEHLGGDGTVLAGKIYTTNGSALIGVPYDAAQLAVKEAGVGSLTFTGDDNGTLTYTLNGTSVVKQITRLNF